jgi:hypothetical protein
MAMKINRMILWSGLVLMMIGWIVFRDSGDAAPIIVENYEVRNAPFPQSQNGDPEVLVESTTSNEEARFSAEAQTPLEKDLGGRWWEDEVTLAVYHDEFNNRLLPNGEPPDYQEFLDTAKELDGKLRSGNHIRLTGYNWAELGEISDGRAWIFVNSTVQSMGEIAAEDLGHSRTKLVDWYLSSNPFKIPPEGVLQIFSGKKPEPNAVQRYRMEEIYWANLGNRARLHSEDRKNWLADFAAKKLAGVDPQSEMPEDFVPFSLISIQQHVSECNRAYIDALTQFAAQEGF